MFMLLFRKKILPKFRGPSPPRETQKKFIEPGWKPLYTQMLRVHCYWKHFHSLLVSDIRKKKKKVTFFRETESFPFRLGHKVSSWALTFGAPAFFRAHFYWAITSPIKKMDCKGNNANVLVQMVSVLERGNWWEGSVVEKKCRERRDEEELLHSVISL